jgi:methylase of polypeptide subunit release factors
MPGARSRRVIAAAAFLLGAALLYAAAPAGSERFFSEHLQAEVVVFPGVHWSSPGEGESTSQAERHVLPFMRLHGEVFRGKKVLDIGCGSGVIALYAAKLGAESVVATDIDPRALENTRFNARRLGFAKKIETRLVRPEDPGAFAVARPGEVFDVIVSNPPWQVDPELKSIRLGLSIVDGLGAGWRRADARSCSTARAISTS